MALARTKFYTGRFGTWEEKIWNTGTTETRRCRFLSPLCPAGTSWEQFIKSMPCVRTNISENISQHVMTFRTSSGGMRQRCRRDPPEVLIVSKFCFVALIQFLLEKKKRKKKKRKKGKKIKKKKGKTREKGGEKSINSTKRFWTLNKWVLWRHRFFYISSLFLKPILITVRYCTIPWFFFVISRKFSLHFVKNIL